MTFAELDIVPEVAMIPGMSLRTDALALLNAYQPLDAERSFHDRMMKLASANGDPFSRHHFQPGHFTASGFVLSPDGKSVLLIHHTKLNRWLQPGGHIELDDLSMVDAAAREVLEETGVVPAVIEPQLFDIDIHPIPARDTEPGHEHFDFRFLCYAPDLAMSASAEVRDARWFSLEDAIEQSGDESVKRVVAKLRESQG